MKTNKLSPSTFDGKTLVLLLEDLYCKTAGEFNDYGKTESDYTTDSVAAVQRFLIEKGIMPKFEIVKLPGGPRAYVVVEKCANLEIGDKIEYEGKLIEFTGSGRSTRPAESDFNTESAYWMALVLARKVVFATKSKESANEFIVEMTNFKL